MMIQRLALVLLLAGSLHAADFQNGQAARAVIGQPSFSARDAGPAAVALTYLKGRLYAADASDRVFTYDVTKVLAASDGANAQPAACGVCGFPAIGTTNQSVMPGIARVAASDNTVVIADPPRHRVMIWLDATSPRGAQGPDVVLGNGSASPVSARSLVDPVSVAFDGKRLFVGDAALHRVLVWNSLPSEDNQPADAVLGQPGFTSATLSDSPGPDTIRTPAALASDGTNLFVADPSDHRILVFTPGDFPLHGAAVINSASLAPGPLAPGTLISIKTNGSAGPLETREQGTGQPLSRKLGGVQLLFNGAALPLLSISSERIEAQLPYDTGAQTSASVYIRTERDGATAVSNAIGIKLIAASPGLYAFGGTEPRTGLMLHAAIADSGLPGSPVTADDPAKPGEELTLWATGLGMIDDLDADPKLIAGVPFSGPAARVLSRVSAAVNGQPVEVRSALLTPGAVGVYEVRVILPGDFRPDPHAELVISQNGYTSNTVRFPIGARKP